MHRLYTSSVYEKSGRVIDGGLYYVRDEAGRPMMMMEGMEFQKISRRRSVQHGDVIPAEAYTETYQNLPLELVDETGAIPPTDCSGHWLVFADDKARVQPLVDAIAGFGGEMEVISGDIFDEALNKSGGSENDVPGGVNNSAPAEKTKLQKLIDAHLSDGNSSHGDSLQGKSSHDKSLRGIIFARGLGQDALTEDADTENVLAQVERDTLALFALGQALDGVGHRDAYPDVWHLTRKARHIAGDDAPGVNQLTQAPLVSLMRTISNECSVYYCAQIDADDETLASPNIILQGMMHDPDETETVYRDGVRFVSRIERRAFDQLPAQQVSVTPGDERNYVVTMNNPGLIDSLELREEEAPQLGDTDVIVKMQAVGLNFRDVMAVTGLLPKEAEEEAWLNLGLEYGAIVEQVGAAVTSLKTGDRVMGMGRRCLQKRKSVQADQLTLLPEHISFEQAATIPSVFVTAHYALNHIGRLRKDDKILIHVATGGVGLAAIQLARLVGAEIFATAGSPEKRQLLRDMGIEHVMDSRTLEFADQIMDITKGRGVDVVLNSLPEDYITKGLEILAPYGRFLEIGKRDVYADSPVGMRALRKNISFSVLDLAALGLERPDYMQILVEELNVMLHARTLEPLPFTAYSVSKVADAFRYMSKAKHIGKVVVTFDEAETNIGLSRENDFRLRAGASYLITGGTRGFGLSIANWMSNCGAGRLVFGIAFWSGC